MNDLSHVGMARCFYCLEESQILLDRRLKDSLPRDCGVVNMEPCSKCQGYMEQGIILIGVKDEAECERVSREHMAWQEEQTKHPRQAPFIPNPYRSGTWVVLKEDALRRFLEANTPLFNQIFTARWAFIPMEVWRQIGLPEGNNSN